MLMAKARLDADAHLRSLQPLTRRSACVYRFRCLPIAPSPAVLTPARLAATAQPTRQSSQSRLRLRLRRAGVVGSGTLTASGLGGPGGPFADGAAEGLSRWGAD